MKRKSLVSAAVVLVVASAVALISSCGWERVDEDSTWNDDYNARFEWVNFSGTYKNTNGWYVVTQPRRPTSSISGGSTSGSGVTPVTYPIAVPTNSVNRLFGGTLHPVPIMPGTVSFHAYNPQGGVEVFSDSDRDGRLFSSLGTTQNGNPYIGFVNYYTGMFSIQFQVGVPEATTVTVTFISGYSSDTNVVITTPPRPGSTRPIYQFVIVQDAAVLTLTDNYGVTYTGRISSISSTTGGTDVDIRPGEVVEINAPFTARGNGVTISGTLVGMYTAAQQNTGITTPGTTQVDYRGRLEGRLVRGVWVEDGGRTGEISANALEAGSTSTTTSVF